MAHRVRELNVFVLAMLSLATVISLRNLPLSASYGFPILYYYCAAAFFFMIPYALISAELASAWPKAGGVFIWVKEALGERLGFMAIWMQWFHNVTWYPTMLAFVGAAIAYLIDPLLADNSFFLLGVILIGFWAITFLNFLGISTSAWFSTFCVIIGALLPGLILIGFATFWILSGNTNLLVARDAAVFSPSMSNWTFLAGIFLALAGLEANANLAREVKNPRKNYPKAIFVAAALTLTLLILGSLSIAVIIPAHQINFVASLLEAFRLFFSYFGIEWLVKIIAIFTILGALGELNAWAIAGVKGLFVTTEYGLLPPYFHKLNSQRIPVRLLIFQALFVTLAALIFLYLPTINTCYWILSALSAQMYLLMYILLFIAAVVLRYKQGHIERPYRVPFGTFGLAFCALMGIASSLFAFLFSFVPPSCFEKGTFWDYQAIMVGGFGLSVLIPLVLYKLKKSNWKRKENF